MAKINIDNLANAVIKELGAFEELTVESVTEAVTKTAKETVAEIREQASSSFNGHQYAKSWAYKRDTNLRGKYKFSLVVYSKPPYYRLTHLLEKGHAKVNGGRVPGRPHISAGEELAQRNLEKNIREAINRDA